MTPTTPTSGTLRNAAVSEIRRQIIAGELTSDVSFSEATLAGQMAMSRAPVREALVVLNQLGWVSSQPRSGYRVSPMTVNEMRDIYTMRSLLEPRAAGLAARQVHLQPVEGAALRTFVDEQDHPQDAEWTGSHYRFHRRITVLALNRELDRTASEMLLKLDRYLALGPVRERLVNDPLDHGALARAILSGDARAAADAAELHVSRSQIAVTEAILESDDIRSVPITAPLQASAATTLAREASS